MVDLDVMCHSVPADEGFKELLQGQLHTYSFKTAFRVTVYRWIISTHFVKTFVLHIRNVSLKRPVSQYRDSSCVSPVSLVYLSPLWST